MTNVVDITPFQVLGRLETVTDFLNAYALTRHPIDDRLLGYVERLRELHRQLGEAIRFIAEADGQYDLSAVAISYGDRSTPPLGSREIKQLWTEYGKRLMEA